MKKLTFILLCLTGFFLVGWTILPNQNGVSTGKRFVVPQKKVLTEYGLFPQQSIVVRSTIKPNQMLGPLLQQFKLDHHSILHLEQAQDSIFDIRKIRSGNRYAAVLDLSGPQPRLREFIYERSKVHYTVCRFGECVQLEHYAKPVEQVSREIGAKIESSLFKSIYDANLNPEIAIELEKIFQWSINFYRIQPGDYFKVMFTENMLEGESVGIQNVEAALFHYRGKDIYAFYYEHPDSANLSGFYDEKGQLLKSAFLQAPVQFTRISSKYTKRRYHPVQKRWKAHLGTDFAAPTGTPIYSTADGVIVAAQYSRYNGNYVKVKHNDTYTTQYLHMSKIKDGIRPGVFVEQGDVIGYVGSTGLATGPHVCYRFWKNGEQVDPFKLDLPKAEPLPENVLPDYLEYIKPLKSRLEDQIDLNNKEIAQLPA